MTTQQQMLPCLRYEAKKALGVGEYQMCIRGFYPEKNVPAVHSLGLCSCTNCISTTDGGRGIEIRSIIRKKIGEGLLGAQGWRDDTAHRLNNMPKWSYPGNRIVYPKQTSHEEWCGGHNFVVDEFRPASTFKGEEWRHQDLRRRRHELVGWLVAEYLILFGEEYVYHPTDT